MATTAERVLRAVNPAQLANSADLAQLRKKLDKTARNARKTANRGISATDAYVHKHPWAAVGLAAGVVALAGIAIAAAIRNPRPSRASLPQGLDEVLRAALTRLKTLRG